MKVYLAGPMSGLPEKNYPEFEKARKFLRSQVGWQVVCPAELNQESTGYATAFKRDIQMLSEEGIEGIVILPGFATSRGAMTELQLAGMFNLPVFFLTIDGSLISLSHRELRV